MRRRSRLSSDFTEEDSSEIENLRNRRGRRRRSRRLSQPRQQPRQQQPRQQQPQQRFITIPFRNHNQLYTITIPAPDLCNGPRPANGEKIYCGTKNEIPLGYTRRGTEFECLKKGFGAGRCSVYSRDREQN